MLTKSSIWDFYEITREEYMNKADNEKKSLIMSFYNHMVRGKICLCFIFVALAINDSLFNDSSSEFESSSELKYELLKTFELFTILK